MRRWGLAFVMTAVLVSGCAPDPPILSPDATIEIVRRGGDMGIDDSLTVRSDGSWTYHSNGSGVGAKPFSQDGMLSDEAKAAVREIVRRPGFVAELSVPRWDAHCIDPPGITIRLDGKESSFVSCDDPDQKNLNDLLHVVLDHVYNELPRVVAAD